MIFLKFSEVRFQNHLVCPQLKFKITKNRSKSWEMMLNGNIYIIFEKYISFKQLSYKCLKLIVIMPFYKI